MIFLKRYQIEDEKWNDCILKSTNGLIYGLTWFLDELSSNWCAFVNEEEGCYTKVFPIPYKRKFGVKYVYPPFFIQQLGLFSTEYSKKEEEKAISLMIKKFKFIELNLNYRGKYGDIRRNLVLRLNRDYETIKKSYSKNHFRNLKKSQKLGLQLRNNVLPSTIIALFKADRGADLKTYSNSDYENLLRLFQRASSESAFISLGVDYNKELICGGFFMKFKNRITFIFSGNSKKGKDSGALFFLLDSIINMYAKSGFILDFEGSENDGLSRFYNGFGASEENYRFLKVNNLPKLLKAFKK